MRVILAITGASGIELANRVIEILKNRVELHIIRSKNAQIVTEAEDCCKIYDNDDITAPTASGSFRCDAMIIVPTSMNTLAKIAHGIADNLVTRSAAVMIKERKKLILSPREMPFSPIALENMVKLSKLGVIIAPPVIGYYSNPKNLKEMEDFIIGKWLDLLEIEHNLFKRWGEE
jgi:4-hydroxy-3-polyprenylbenzoate decarboxylase